MSAHNVGVIVQVAFSSSRHTRCGPRTQQPPPQGCFSVHGRFASIPRQPARRGVSIAGGREVEQDAQGHVARERLRLAQVAVDAAG
jgi:hypothetical protein